MGICPARGDTKTSLFPEDIHQLHPERKTLLAARHSNLSGSSQVAADPIVPP